jgi:hypothetical protein
VALGRGVKVKNNVAVGCVAVGEPSVGFGVLVAVTASGVSVMDVDCSVI